MFRYSPSGILKDIYIRSDAVGPTVLEGATFFDGGDWIEDAAVIVEAATVRSIGPRKTIERPKGARAVSLEGRWLIPGLVDCRSHPVGRPPDEVPRPQSTRFKTSGPILAHRAVREANRMLGTGITALAQLGGGDVEYVHGLRDAVRAGLLAAPTVVSAGTPLSPIAGGIEAWAEPGLDPDRRLPGTGMLRRPSRQSATVAGTPDGWRKAIRRNFVDGADMVMLLLTGTAESEELAASEAELAAATHEAQRVGASVACQATGSRPAKAAVRAGVDLLVLGPTQPDDELISLLSSGRTAWAPGLAEREAGPALRAAVKRVSDAGGRVVVGTGWRPERPVGFGAEVAMLLSAGLDPGDAIAAATIGGGEAIGLIRGRVSAGARADLVALDFDPRRSPEGLGEAANVKLIVHAVPLRRLTPLQSILGVRAAS